MEYQEVFNQELHSLKEKLNLNSDKRFLISKLGAGLANRYGIWEKVIKDELIKTADIYFNVILL